MAHLLQPLLLALIVGVIFVNGWTDAPNAIVTVVTTGVLPYGRAVSLAALCNLLGVAVMSLLHPTVAAAITSLVPLDPAAPIKTCCVLCAAMGSIVLFSLACWIFGLPSSESHALLAALLGAGLAADAQGNLWAGLSVVLWGLVLSLLTGFLFALLLAVLFQRSLERLPVRTLHRCLTLSAAGMAFLHGAQDGQKFVGILVTADLLAKGVSPGGELAMGEHLPSLLLCAAAMGLGTSVGGRRIIQKVGGQMARLNLSGGLCSDGGACLSLGMLTLLGLPVSTTHTRTAAAAGAALSLGREHLGLRALGEMVLAWVLTFPLCGILGYLLTHLLLHLC